MSDVITVLIGAVMSVTAPMLGAESLDRDQVRCMADNIYFEGRSESIPGQLGIALVTMNRVKSSDYPSTVCDVVLQGPRYKKRPDLHVRNRCQFSWVCDGKSDKIPLLYTRTTKNHKKGNIREHIYRSYATAIHNAMLVMTGQIYDFTYGATHYYAHDIVTPKWAKFPTMTETAIIDGHTYMREDNKLAAN